MTDLRLYQLASAKLLKIFTSYLSTKKLQYWLAYGTLLGAFRHRGFIPWDDDIDLGMERKDYCILQKLLPKTEFFYQDADLIRILIKGTRVSIDVFPYDRGSSEWLSPEDLASFQKKLLTLWTDNKDRLYKRQIIDKLHWSRADRLYVKRLTAKHFDKGIEGGYLYQAWHSKLPNEGVFKHSDIYPLGEIEFEGRLYPSPSNIKLTLSRTYPNYYQIPAKESRTNHGLYKNMTVNERKILLQYIGEI